MKKNRILIRLYLIASIFIIYICLNENFSLKKKITPNNFNVNNNYNRLSKLSSINKDKQFIIVKNAEKNFDIFAKIIIQNKINYTPKMSIIIPVFNAGNYLKHCLESVINQSLKEIEIICIDECSTDNTLEILKKYAEKDKRFTIIKQEKINSFDSRNTGLSIAKGKYSSFLSQDNYYDLNMLEQMYNDIITYKSDIIISQCKYIENDYGLFNKEILNNTLKIDLIIEKNPFSLSDITNNIFQICEGFLWDKLFRTDFILYNNLKFRNIQKYSNYDFTYTALCLAKSITTTKQKFIVKKYVNKELISYKLKEEPSLILSLFDKIKDSIEKKGLFHLVKKSYWKWVIKLCINQLKILDKSLKEKFFSILHNRFSKCDFIDKFIIMSEKYRELHYIKNHKEFPTINIAITTNNKYFNYSLVTICSILLNSEYENINIILLYKYLNETDLYKIYKLKEIRDFSLQIIKVSENQINDLNSKENIIKENLLNYLLDERLYSLTDIDNIIYINYNTLIRKSILPLWEINMNDKLIAGVEDILLGKDKIKSLNLKDNFYINSNILLININKWKKELLCSKIINKIKNDNQELNQDILNFFTDTNKIRLNKEFNYQLIISNNNNYQYNEKFFKEYKEKDPTIITLYGNNINEYIYNNIFKEEFFKYNNILNNLINKQLTIPVVLYLDNKSTPLMYTTIISILENAYRSSYYIFYLLIPNNYSKNNENLILEMNNKYKCYIKFIYFQKILDKMNISMHDYYLLLIADLLPKEIDKCIFLNVNTCVNKDLSDLFNIDMKDNYLAGVIASGYYFSEEFNCKRLNISSMKQYINAGMLLINIKHIRKDNMTQKFIELIKNNYITKAQDVLNVACYGKIITLPPKYNAMVFRLKENNPLLKHLYKVEDIIEAKEAPYIINYSEKNKPWNSIGTYMEKYWWNIAKKTPYINNLFSREEIYKKRLKYFWYTINKKTLDLQSPITFNEKIQWLKLYETTPIKTRLSDKYLVREWVSDKIGEEYLIPLLGVYDKFEEINFEKLPNRFVIKCNHGSAYNIIVKNKTILNLKVTKSRLEQWMNENYAYNLGLELQYRDIQPKIIIEKYMDDGTGDLRDYKFHCFKGRPYFLWADSGRHTNHQRNLYDLKWNQLPYKINSHYSTFPSPKKPKTLEKMIELASILSENFTYVRVDLYEIEGKVYFSEMTFTTSSGIEDIIPEKFEKKLSKLLKLPKFVYNIDTGEYYKLGNDSNLFTIYMTLIFILFKLFIHL